MRWPGGGRWTRVFRLGGVERDLDEELSYHFDRTVEELEAAGFTRAQAESEAARRFGDRSRWRRELQREDRLAAAVAGVLATLRAAADVLRASARTLLRSPALAAGIIVTFALGVGANAVMFGVVDRLLLRAPEGIVAPEEVRRVMVERHVPWVGERRTVETFTYPDYEDLRGLPSLAGVAAYSERNLVVGRGEEAYEADGVHATGSYFRVLGVRPALGRFFGEAEDRIGGERVAVISHGLWQRRFGGDPAVLGRTLDLGFGTFEVIGVAPRGFTGVEIGGADLWLPMLSSPDAERFRESRNWWMLRIVARLAPSTTPAAFEAQATTVYRRAMEELAAERRARAVAAGRSPVREGPADPEVIAASLIAARGPLASDESAVARWLAGVSFLVLLIACANVANLLLARTARRRREVAVRLALGVSRRRLAAEMLAEGLLLAVAGAVAALAVAHWGGSLVRGTLLPDIAWESAPGLRLVAFTLVLALAAALAATMLPVVQATREEVTHALRAGGRGVSGGGSRLRSGLTALQAALSVVLLVGAGLFVRSLDRVNALDMGFEPDGLLLVEPVATGLEAEDRWVLFEAARARLGAVDVIESATMVAGSLPFYSTIVSDLRVPGLDSLPFTGELPAMHLVDGEYFTTMRLGVREGRAIEPTDVRGAEPVAVVNAPFASAVWPGESPLGKCFHVEDGPCLEVVGVAQYAQQFGVAEEARPQYYLPLMQQDAETAPQSLLVRVRDGVAGGDATRVAPSLRRAFLQLDPRLRYANVTPVKALIAPYTRSWELGATVFTLFGLLALVVAAIGLYSVLAYEVAQRRPEIGIRSALGASRERIVRQVVGRALGVAGTGLAAGLLAALVLAPRIRDLLYGVSPHDAVTLTVVITVLLSVAVAASLGPAWRASRVDPNEALRAE